MRAKHTVIAAVAVFALALPGCLGGQEVELEDAEPAEDSGLCFNDGGTWLRCVDLVSGDCATQWRTLAPEEGEWHFGREECGVREGAWLEPAHVEGQAVIYRVITVTEHERTEEWVVTLLRDDEVCFERYAVRYVSPDVGCE